MIRSPHFLLAAAGLAGLLGACGPDHEATPVFPAAERQIEVAGANVQLIECGDPGDPAVLLLHGAAFSAATWQELGTIDQLAAAGNHVLAVNLPGKEASATSPLSGADFLVALLDTLGLETAVVVSPSASGIYSLPLMAEHPDRLRGLVAVAPVGIPAHLEALRGSAVPVLTIWSQDDRVVPSSHGDDLALAINGSWQLTLPGDVHPVYLAHTEAFHRELLKFLEQINAR